MQLESFLDSKYCYVFVEDEEKSGGITSTQDDY